MLIAQAPDLRSSPFGDVPTEDRVNERLGTANGKTTSDSSEVQLRSQGHDVALAGHAKAIQVGENVVELKIGLLIQIPVQSDCPALEFAISKDRSHWRSRLEGNCRIQVQAGIPCRNTPCSLAAAFA